MLPIVDNIAAVRKRLKKLELSGTPALHEDERECFRYYGLDFPDTGHYFGLLRHGQCDLATHVFLPQKYRSVTVLVHGYLEHSGYFRHAVRRLLRGGYAVVLFDLPGHGLSSGKPASIRDFSLYADALEHVIRYCGKKLRKPLHLVAHSMGCSAAVELLLTRKSPPVEKVVLVAPLVHPVMWPATRLAYRVLSPVVKKVPRAFPILSSDREFLMFSLFKDPLLRKKIPLPWVRAMFRWNKRLEEYAVSMKEICIIQGTRDLMVDGKYNIACLQKKFPNAVVHRILHANHQLFNEARKYRTRTLDLIVRSLQK